MDEAQDKVMSSEAKLVNKQILIEKIESEIREKEESLRERNEVLTEKDQENSMLRMAIIAVLTLTIGIAAVFIYWMTKVEIKSQKIANTKMTENVFYRPPVKTRSLKN